MVNKLEQDLNNSPTVTNNLMPADVPVGNTGFRTRGHWPTGARAKLGDDEFDRLNALPFDQVIAEMADQKKVDLALKLIEQISTDADPSALKILNSVLERQGVSLERELPISDDRFREIITFAAGEISRGRI